MNSDALLTIPLPSVAIPASSLCTCMLSKLAHLVQCILYTVNCTLKYCTMLISLIPSLLNISFRKLGQTGASYYSCEGLLDVCRNILWSLLPASQSLVSLQARKGNMMAPSHSTPPHYPFPTLPCPSLPPLPSLPVEVQPRGGRRRAASVPTLYSTTGLWPGS